MPVAPDFLSACIDALQADSACATAFGSTAQNPKFFGVLAGRTTASPNTLPSNDPAKAVLPYARLLEVGGDETFQSGAPAPALLYYERGRLQVDVFDTSPTGARTKSKLIFKVLNDGNIQFADGGLLELRLTRQFFMPEPDSGTGGTNIVSHRVQEYLYVIEYSTPPTGY